MFAFAKTVGIDEIESFALALARHFVDDVAPVTAADVRIEYAWERIDDHDHGFHKAGSRCVRRASWSTRTAPPSSAASATWSC